MAISMTGLNGQNTEEFDFGGTEGHIMKAEAVCRIIENGRVTYTIRHPGRDCLILQRSVTGEGKVLFKDKEERFAVITSAEDEREERNAPKREDKKRKAGTQNCYR